MGSIAEMEDEKTDSLRGSFTSSLSRHLRSLFFGHIS